MSAIHSHPSARPGHPAPGLRRFSALVAGVLLSLNFVSPLGAQTTDDLAFVQHISLDFAHKTILNTNISLYYRDASGDLQAPPTYYAPGGTGLFQLLSTDGNRTLSYSAGGAFGTPQAPTGWHPITLFDMTIVPLQNSVVSYTPVPTIRTGPNETDNSVEEEAIIPGIRSSLYSYNINEKIRTGTTTLSTDPSGPPYTLPRALLATGQFTSLLVTNGEIYSLDARDFSRNIGQPLGSAQIQPLVTAQGSGPGELNNPTAMNVGPDGLLYVLDYGNNRIQKFDPVTGEFRGQFALPDGVTIFSTSLAISADGHIYLGDGLGGGSVLSLNGDLLGTFHPPEPDGTWVDGGLIAGSPVGAGSFLEYDGMGNIFTYVEGQGLTMFHDPSFQVVPEPSTWALVLGGVALLFGLRRRAGRASAGHPAPGLRRFSALVAGILLSLNFVVPLSAQTTDDLAFVQHISVDFPHYSILNTNISLYYHDAYGDLQPPPPTGTSSFYLFSAKDWHYLRYNSDGAPGSGNSGWSQQIIFSKDMGLTSGSEVSFTPIATGFAPPTNGAPLLYQQNVTITGTHSTLFNYDVIYQTRSNFGANNTTLSTDPSGPHYTPGNALLTTGFYTSLLTTNGGIYLVDTRNSNPGLLTPLVTAQGSGPGELNNPTAMNVGPDGLLYVLDYGNNRIQKFNLTTGAYVGQFALPDGVTIFSTSLAISADGHIYLGDGLGGGSVLSLNGDLLGTFHPPEPDASWVDGGLIAGSPVGAGSFLEYDGMGNIFTYVEGQGLTMFHDPSFQVVPEPSTWALVLGGVALLFGLRRRAGAALRTQ